jgi:uncharacterized protein (DUF362 family)
MKPFLSNSTVFVHDAGTSEYEGALVRSAVAEIVRNILGGDTANPLSGFVEEGNTVLVKPNMIREHHLLNETWEQVVTHGTVIEAVVDLCYKALNGTGRIIIGDGPQNDADFPEVCKVLGLDDLRKRYQRDHNFEIEVIDFRVEKWIRDIDGVTTDKIPQEGDPRGFVPFDLTDRSEFTEERDYYGADADYRETQRCHSGGHNKYLMSKTPLEADVFINLPKMKTHKKAGVTLSLKNLVGVHGHRNYLPHHVMGTPRRGGDEYPDASMMNELQGAATKTLKKVMARRGGKGGTITRAIKNMGYKFFGSTEEVVRSGNWHGNDTTWRMVLDLNKLLFYGDHEGEIRDKLNAPKYLSIVDGIVGGEGNGPLAPDPKPCGLLIGGMNPVAVDCVCARLMGFDIDRIPKLRNAFSIEHLPLVDFAAEDIRVESNRDAFNRQLTEIDKNSVFLFEPHFGWKGFIELE